MKTNRVMPRWTYLLFIPPYIAVFWVSSYNTAQPDWMGIPFFYWSQLMWVAITAVLIAIVFFNLREESVADTDDAR